MYNFFQRLGVVPLELLWDALFLTAYVAGRAGWSQPAARVGAILGLLLLIVTLPLTLDDVYRALARIFP